MLGPEAVLLNVGNTFHEQADGIKNHTSNVSSCAKWGLAVLRDIRAVEEGYRQGYRPYPEHLKDPKAEKLEEVVALVVEAIILSGLENAEQQET